MVGILVSFWEDLFSGFFAVSFREGNRKPSHKKWWLVGLPGGLYSVGPKGFIDSELILTLDSGFLIYNYYPYHPCMVYLPTFA